jgi:7-cyano-7-deazaguanine synthase
VRSMALGTLGDNPFADATAEFFQDYARLLSSALGQPLEVQAPFRGTGKAELVRRFFQLPLGLTLTCIAPVAGIHCGACNKCRERREAFDDAGVTDSAAYAPRSGREVA